MLVGTAGTAALLPPPAARSTTRHYPRLGTPPPPRALSLRRRFVTNKMRSPWLTGRERYAGDLALPGLLHARPVLSLHAHARLVGIDAEAARRVPGVVAVLTAADLPFASAGGPPRAAESLAREEIVDAGQPVALVLAEDEATAETAAHLVAVEAEPLPAVLDPAAAMAPESPQVRVLSRATEDEAEAAMHGVGGGEAGEEQEELLSPNVSGRTHLSLGDVARGFAEAE